MLCTRILPLTYPNRHFEPPWSGFQLSVTRHAGCIHTNMGEQQQHKLTGLGSHLMLDFTPLFMLVKRAHKHLVLSRSRRVLPFLTIHQRKFQTHPNFQD